MSEVRSATSSRLNMTPLLDVLTILIFTVSLRLADRYSLREQELAAARAQAEQQVTQLAEQLARAEADKALLAAEKLALEEQIADLRQSVNQAELFRGLSDQERGAFTQALDRKLSLIYLYIRDNRLAAYRPHTLREPLPFSPEVPLFAEEAGQKRYRGGFFPLVDDELPIQFSQKQNRSAIYPVIDERDNYCPIIDGIIAEYFEAPRTQERLVVLPLRCAH